MSYESFFTDMVIDTPEKAERLNEYVESGITWKSNGSKIVFADKEFIRKVIEKYNPKD